MATICKVTEPEIKEIINQGDIFRDVTYIYKTVEEGDRIIITEFTFPYSIVLSQSCDVYAMNQLMKTGGKTLKFMPSILMSPIFDIKSMQDGTSFGNIVSNLDLKLEHDSNILTKSDDSVLKKDYHYRFHKFEMGGCYSELFETSVIDFKQYFTVCPEYLFTMIENRLCSLEHIFCQQITQKFAVYLSRVGIP